MNEAPAGPKPQEITKSEGRAERPQPAPASEGFWQPLAVLRSEVDRLFDSFWGGRSPAAGQAVRAGGEPMPFLRGMGFGAPSPAIDLVEGEKEYRITAELPGLDVGDVELSVANDMLTISGEKSARREEKKENYYLSERHFGSFRRAFQLSGDVDRNRISASFDKGVLTVTLPKTEDAAAQRRKIEIKPQG